MHEISYLAYNEEFFPLVERIIADLNIDLGMQVYDPNHPEKITESNVKVALARGKTAMRVRESLDIPVVEIPIPFDDMIEAIIEASKLGSQIGIIGYDNIIRNLNLLNPILKANITQEFAVDEEDTRRKIQKFKDDGIQVVVGGVIQTNIARSLGLNAVRLDFSKKSIATAYAEAVSIYNSLMYNLRRNQELNAILDNSRDGYIAVDNQGKISLLNNRAKGLVSHVKEPLGAPLIDVFPELEHLIDSLNNGEVHIQEICYLKGITVLYNLLPLKTKEGKILGAMMTFSDIKTITEGEHKIRKKELSKGFFAKYRFSNILGKSKSIRFAINNGKKFAKTDSTIMIIGETGVGKELFAQSIHNYSLRANGPFVAVNCSSLPESILESELFGYEEGAFTGARKQGKPGLFELAHGGTIFLDEISEMPTQLQARFLRVIEEKQVMRLGSDQIIPVDVRVISATNRSIKHLVSSGDFRQDLFYRLNVLTIVIPSLKERLEDIDVFVEHFSKEFFKDDNTSLSSDALEVIRSYNWPGNIRQLENFMEKISIIRKDQLITGEDIEEMLNIFEPCCIEDDYMETQDKPPIEREEIVERLKEFEGSRVKTAEALGIHRSTLWRLMKKYDL
ncbi:MAG: sigma 54-interacting transcriptional regulator [Tissierellia bacterium]|nr:sigma 54-interacting transcriptional regulator [Tissierellia bacterium]